jgi:lactoylglutathione lyase
MTALHHIAIWVSDIDAASQFWSRYFGAEIGEQYESKRQHGFLSRFATFGSPPVKIELMYKPGLAVPGPEAYGWTHIAISLGSEKAVDEAAGVFRNDKLLESEPRWTGDGFYEAVVRAPDGSLVEITI